MTIGAFIQLIGACLGVVGSLFFAIGIMRQSIAAMANLSGTYWRWNPHMVTALAAQKADYLFGGGIIVLAFLAQLVSFLVPPNIVAFTRDQGRVVPWVGAICTLVVFILLRVLARLLAKRYERQINARVQNEVHGN